MKTYLVRVVASNKKEGGMTLFMIAELSLGEAFLIVFFGLLLIWKIFDRISLRKLEREERILKSEQKKKKDK